MKTGFAQVNINEGIDFIMGGMFLEYKCKEVHTPLFASAAAFEDGSTKVIWVSCDLGSMKNENFMKVREYAAEQTGLSADNIIVSLTHTHNGPTMANSSIYSKLDSSVYKPQIIDRIVKACEAAWENRRELKMGYGSVEAEKCCFNRRYLMDHGKSEMHPGGPDNPHRLMKEGPEDNELNVLWFENDDRVDGVIVHFSAHPSIMYGLKIISGDYPAVIKRIIQKIYGDIPVLFLLGCCGNTCAINHEEKPVWGIKRAEQVGKILAAEAIKIIEQARDEIKVQPSQISMEYIYSTVKLEYNKVSEKEINEAKRQYERWKNGEETIKCENGMVENVDKWAKTNKAFLLYEKIKESPFYNAPVSALRIADIIFVTNPAELFIEYQLNMKKRICAERVIAVEKTNGRCVYVPTRQGHMLGGYEIEQGLFDWRAGHKIEETCIRLGNRVAKNKL